MKKGLAVVLAALLGLQCITAFAADGFTESFTGKTGSALEDGWALNLCTADTVGQYVADPLDAENTVVEFFGKGSGWSPMTMKKTYSTPVPVPESGKMTISYRFLFEKDNAAKLYGEIYGCGIVIGQGDIALANVAVTKQNSRSMRFLNQNLYRQSGIESCLLTEPFLCTSAVDGNDSTKINYFPQYNVWNYVRLECNFNTETIDVYGSAGTPIAEDAQPFVEDMPFVTNDTKITAIDTITISGSADQKLVGTMLDDVSIVPVPEGGSAEPTVSVAATAVSAQANETEATLRFASAVTGDGATAAGACILPLWIFETDENSDKAATVTISEALTDGQTFGVDVEGIPAAQFGTVIVAKPFVMAGDTQVWGEIDQSSVDEAIAQ